MQKDMVSVAKHPNEMIDGDRVLHSLLRVIIYLKYQVPLNFTPGT